MIISYVSSDYWVIKNSNLGGGMSDTDPVYDEACRIVGQSCLMLAQNGDEISRAQVAY